MTAESDPATRISRGRSYQDAQFPAVAAAPSLPEWYPDLLASVSDRVTAGRRHAATTVTTALTEELTSSLPRIQDIDAELAGH